MLKWIFSFLVGVVTTMNCIAQLSLGVRVGLNYSTLITDHNEAYDFKPGYMLAANFKAYVHDKLSLRPELQFTSMGYHLPYSPETGATLNYLSMPAFFGYDINDVISIYAGPQPGLLLTVRENFDRLNPGPDMNPRDSYRFFDIGAAVGIGFDFSGVNIGLRYYRTLPFFLEKDEMRDPISSSFTFYRATNSSFQLSVAFQVWKR